MLTIRRGRFGPPISATSPIAGSTPAGRAERILHINKFLYRRGGAEGYMEDLAALQQASGHEVAFFGMAHAENTHTEYQRWFPTEVEFEPVPASLAGKARGAARMLWSTTARRGLEQVLTDFEPDVAHLHNIYHQLSPSILQALADRGIPVVMTLHDYKLACPSYQFLNNGEVCEACLGGRFHHAALRRCRGGSALASAVLGLESFIHSRLGAYGRVHRFVCPSRFMAEKMAAGGVYPERLRWVPHFVDPTTVAPAERAGDGIIFAGRLSSEKGVDTLIDAMAHIGGAHLRVAGDGPERAALEARAEAVAPGRVHFLGRLDRASLHEHVRSAAVLAMPSRWYENQPMIVLEAMACGVPVVGTDLGGTRELITPGRDGALTPANDPVALADTLRPFVSDPERAHDMGREGRRKVETHFSPQVHLERLAEVYAEARAAGHDPAVPAAEETRHRMAHKA